MCFIDEMGRADAAHAMQVARRNVALDAMVCDRVLVGSEFAYETTREAVAYAARRLAHLDLECEARPDSPELARHRAHALRAFEYLDCFHAAVAGRRYDRRYRTDDPAEVGHEPDDHSIDVR
jgi:hypothetical protein